MRKLIFAVAILPSLASGAVYKCVDSDGRVSFSDRACAGAEQGSKVKVKPANSGGMLGLPEDYKRRDQERADRQRRAARDRLQRERSKALANRPCKRFSDTELRTMTIRNQVVPGMTVSDARKAWGTPSRINGWQYVYRWGSAEASYFYIKNGCVHSVDGAYRGSAFVR